MCGVHIGQLCKVECKLGKTIKITQRIEKRMTDYCNGNWELLNGIVSDKDCKV